MTAAKAKAPQRSWIETLAASPVLWLLPLMVVLLAIFVFPIFETVRLSFTNANLVGSDYEYTLGSYASLFTSPYFFNMLKVTAIFVFFSVAFQMLFGFLIALAVDQGARRGMRASIVTRTAVLSAWAIPGVLIGIIWSILYQQSAGGILNYALSLVGLGSVPFLSDPEIALASVTIANIWRGTAFSMILIYAGLQTLPGDVKHLSHGHPPGGPDPLVVLAGARHPFFLVESIRFMARHTTERLTSNPATARRQSQRCWRVANGRSLRSSSSSFLACSSSS